ncbi:MAG: protein kinase [Planctomycetota bacterium]
MTTCEKIDVFELIHSDDEAFSHEVSQHLESCEYCQGRLARSAADEQQWEEVPRWLTDEDESLATASLNARDRWERRENQRLEWSDGMASSLLSVGRHPELLGRIGRYDVERMIGRGGMGVVFKAHDTELNRPVAVKMLAPNLAEHGSARQRFAREARAAAAVVDDHVVAIHNVEADEDQAKPPFLVMKFIGGGSLQQRLDREGPLSVCEVLRIGMHVAKGLAAAHAQGLIHRDVKPSNILLDEGVERALLTDFGLARAEDDACLTRSGFHPGTPHYMSPEQVRGEAIDGRSDLFSLGCVLYALCTGHPPFRADTGYAVLRRITDEQPRPILELNPDVPFWLQQIVMRLLSKSPDDRLGPAQRVAGLLEECLAHAQHPTTAQLPPVVAAPSPPRKTRPAWIKWLAGGLFSFSLIVAGMFIVLELNKGTLTIESETAGVPIRIRQGDDIVKRLTVAKDSNPIRIAAGNYIVELDGSFDDVDVEKGHVSLSRNGSAIVTIAQPEEEEEAGQANGKSIPFEIGDNEFFGTDNIQIESVTSSGDGFEIGSTVTVEGEYTLNSADQARLCFFSTVPVQPGQKPTATQVQSSQRMRATRGTHRFKLSKTIQTLGWPHVSFYDSETGQGRGGVYFGDGANVLKKKGWSIHSSQDKE